MQAEVVGFIGLGAMGGPMAANLVRAGHPVVGFDPSPERGAAAREAGVRLAGSCAEVATEAAGTVISVVRDADQTREVVYGDQGLLQSDRRGLDLLVMSTLDPTTMRRLAEDLSRHGIAAADAPVSGGTQGAERGDLAIMTSGDPGVLERARPLLDAMGGHVFTIGDRPGMAQAAKLANQLMLAVNMLGIQEGLQLAAPHGVDEETLMRLLAVSTGGSWAVRNWERVREFWRHPAPGAELDIICKDLRSALREADHLEASIPMTAVAFQRIRQVWRQ
jgi:3-hydroxyisobutyrate dehydrogenase-like beta-hydroxyacid dehydrogenase